MILLRLARWIGLTLLAVAVIVLGGWSAVAIWFRFDAIEPVRDLLAGIVVLLTVVAAVCLATSRRWIAIAAYAVFLPPCLCGGPRSRHRTTATGSPTLLAM